MKLKFLFIVFLAIASLQSMAQDIGYYYDGAGNRISRFVIPPAPPALFDGKETEVYEDIMGEKTLRIYPNPTRGKMALEIINYDSEDMGSLKVFDMSGRLIFHTETLTENMEIDITSEPPGSYIMIFIIAEVKTEWKIIKQ